MYIYTLDCRGILIIWCIGTDTTATICFCIISNWNIGKNRIGTPSVVCKDFVSIGNAL